MSRPPAPAGRRVPPRGAHARAHRGLCRLALALSLGAGCSADDAPADDGADDTSDDTTGGPPLPPTFAHDQLSVPTTRTHDVVLPVAGVVPGRTDVVIDGVALGLTRQDAPAGRFEAGSLVLHVRGSMVEGLHHMRMRIIDPSGVIESAAVQVRVVDEVNATPVAGPAAPTGLEGQRLVAVGEGRDALLVVLDAHALGPRLHLVPRGETGWDVDGVRTIAAPGLGLRPGEQALPAAALRRSRAPADPGRVRVAFRVGVPGTRIDVLDVPWDDATLDAVPQASLTLDAALAGRAAEWAELGRPWLLANQVIAELWAPVDVESPRPGDRSLVWSRIHDDEPILSEPQRVTVRAALVDLDRLGPAVDRVASEGGGPPIVGIRVDRRQPLVLEHDPAGGLRPRPTVQRGTDRTFSHVDLPLATVVGAFGSRTVASIATGTSGRVRVAAIDDIGDAPLRDTSLSDDVLPPFAELRGELAPGSVAGVTVFLVPYGSAQPVHALHTTGDVVRATPLPTLQCEAVALAPSPDPDGELPLGCIRDGELWLGSLGATL
jgi:hypothetical protein